MQGAESKAITGAFGKNLGERWPDLPTGAEAVKRADLFVFEFQPEKPLPGLQKYRAWVSPATMEICRISASGAFGDDRSFSEFFQKMEHTFGRLSPLTPAEGFKPPDRRFWSATKDGRTALIVRRADGRATVDLFDSFLGSQPLDDILSAKGAQDSDVW